MTNEVSTQLSILREKYHKGLLSVIVGAGFSRNACEEYPLWKDLLYDMVVELYEEDIDTSFLRYKKITPGDKLSLEAFKEKEALNIIGRVGYLKIVSEYITRKGYREAIEHYIEERIPYIDTDSQQFRFAGKNKGKSFPIVPDNFAAHTKLLEGRKWERIYTTNYDRLLEYACGKDDKEYKIITKAKDLSVSRETPSIIKLHGDLYNPNEKRFFMFDGNPHQQYIISEEDYLTYPQKHEAFTQLMRISLLQGAFCLIGFSGDDPNFINWINWVRDVLITDETSNSINRDQYKIFLVGMTKDEPDDVRKIFYENHNIFFIPLLSDDVKDIIKANGIDEPRELFCKFFDFIYEKDVKGEMSLEDTQSGKTYLQLWDSVYNIKYDKDNPLKMNTSIFIDDDILNKLYALKPWNRFVYYAHRQIAFLREVERRDAITVAEARLALLALRDSGLPIDDKLIKLISESGVNDEGIESLHLLTERAKTIFYSVYDEPIKAGGKYEEILRALYSLDYKQVQMLLENWTPLGPDVIKKAMILSVFDKEAASNLLADYIKVEPSEKEQYYATRMLTLVENQYSSNYSFDRFENANVQDYYKVLSNLKNRALEKKEKIGRYGDAKNQKVIYLDDKPTKTLEAFSLLDFLIEAPAFVSYRNFYTLMSSEEWYEIHKNLYERCPLPALYYSLQCTDGKVKTRIGQDYAYSDQLAKDCLDDVLTNLLKAYLAAETPKYLLSSILNVAKEIFVSVNPKKWEDLFMRIWEDVVLRYRFAEDAKDRMFDDLDLFVEKGLNSLKTLSLRQKIINDLLANVKTDTRFVINCLYYLHVIPSDLLEGDGLRNAVNDFVKGINTPSELNVAGNIYRLLTDEQKEVCAQKCVAMLQNKDNEISELVYRISQYFVKDDAERRAVFIKSVCQNPLLWKNGVMENGGFASFTFLHLSTFTRKVYINQSSLVYIFEQMKVSAEIVLNYLDTYGIPLISSEISSLLFEMLSFQKYYEKRLQNADDFYEIRERISEAYRKISGISCVEDGLLSVYEYELNESLNYIQVNNSILTHKELVGFIDIIIKRVLMKNSDGLDTCIYYLRLFLKEKLITMEDEGLIGGILRILERYQKDDVQECNMDLVMTARDLGKIAIYLNRKGVRSNGIEYWLMFKKESRFYTNWG